MLNRKRKLSLYIHVHEAEETVILNAQSKPPPRGRDARRGIFWGGSSVWKDFSRLHFFFGHSENPLVDNATQSPLFWTFSGPKRPPPPLELSAPRVKCSVAALALTGGICLPHALLRRLRPHRIGMAEHFGKQRPASCMGDGVAASRIQKKKWHSCRESTAEKARGVRETEKQASRGGRYLMVSLMVKIHRKIEGVGGVTAGRWPPAACRPASTCSAASPIAARPFSVAAPATCAAASVAGHRRLEGPGH